MPRSSNILDELKYQSDDPYVKEDDANGDVENNNNNGTNFDQVNSLHKVDHSPIKEVEELQEESHR